MSDYGHAITTRQMIAAAVLLGHVSGPSFVAVAGRLVLKPGWTGRLAVVLNDLTRSRICLSSSTMQYSTVGIDTSRCTLERLIAGRAASWDTLFPP